MERLKDSEKLWGELEEEKRKNEIIRRLSIEISQLSGLREKLENILEMLDEVFGLKHTMLLLPDDKQNVLSVFASRGFEEEGLGTRVKFGEGVIGVVAFRKRKLRMSNISRQRHYVNVSSGTKTENNYTLPGLKNVESQIAIPLISNEELVAVLSAESADIHFFSQEDEEFLMTFSQLLAISIHNAVILDKLEQKVADRTAALESQKKELQQLNASKDRLFSIIGHDLRSPAASLQNVTDLLHYYQQKGDMQQLYALGGRISKAAHNINYMLDNLLNWSVSQTGDLKLNPERISVSELFEEIIDIYTEMFTFKNISIREECPDSLFILADRNATLSILRNLLCNSVKFTPQGGSIFLSAHQLEENICIEIRDTGIGMDERKLQNLFTLNTSSTRGTDKEKGTGLGMLLVNEFVKQSNGSIEVSSLPSAGTRVCVILPGSI